jgi:DNA ligase N terminus
MGHEGPLPARCFDNPSRPRGPSAVNNPHGNYSVPARWRHLPPSIPTPAWWSWTSPSRPPSTTRSSRCRRPPDGRGLDVLVNAAGTMLLGPEAALPGGAGPVAEAQEMGSQGRKPKSLIGLLAQATPLEARYLVRTVFGSLRLGIGTATILDALAEVHAGGRKVRPVLERAYNVRLTSGWSRPPSWMAGWPRSRACRSRPATRCGPCWPSASASRPRSWPSSAGRARPSTRTTASGSRTRAVAPILPP